MAYTTIDDPSKYFEVVHWTGTGGARTISGLNHKPDLIWTKPRSKTYNHMWSDSSRGFNANSELGSNSTAIEGGLSAETYGYKSGHTADGWTMVDGTDSSDDQEDGNTNEPNVTYSGWTWAANGGTTSSLTGGTINATVQANTTSKFSIGIYSGNNTAGATVEHGLGVKPDMIIIKNRSDGVGHSWAVYHSGIGATYGMQLNGTDGQSDNTIWFNDTEPTTSVFSVGSSGSATNSSGSANNRVFYAMAACQGYSKFGTWTGNGDANGPFVYTGFQPKFVLYKKSSSNGGDWVITDNKNNPANIIDKEMYANLSAGGSGGTSVGDVDLLHYFSNGFKLARTHASQNGDGNVYIYAAFAENPFVSSEGVPVTAR
tara:strand:+ start:2063 stop:3178 length:1116 start_codon:yes stop_codon:yes gene_type:complete